MSMTMPAPMVRTPGRSFAAAGKSPGRPFAADAKCKGGD
jgi:hypothetical protein